MLVLLIASLLLAGTGLGWFAHRAYVRIEAWGRAMNRQDAILRSASDEEIDGALRRVRTLRFEEPAADSFHALSAK
jgi:hypothetical protein